MKFLVDFWRRNYKLKVNSRKWFGGATFPYRVRLRSSDGAEIASVYVVSKERGMRNEKRYNDFPEAATCEDVSDFDVNCLLGGFMNILSANVYVFSVVIQPNANLSYQDVDSIVKSISRHQKRECMYYTTFREPFEWAKSFFFYLKGKQSEHEPTHGRLSSGSFVDYLSSNEIADSWVIRFCVGVPDNVCLSENDFEKACSVFDDYQVRDVQFTDELLNFVFGECYAISMSPERRENVTEYKDSITYDSLDEEIKKRFEERCMYSIRLYRRYCS